MSPQEIRTKLEAGFAIGFEEVMFYQDKDYEDTYFNMVFDDEGEKDQSFETLEDLLAEVEFYTDEECTVYRLEDDYWIPVE